MNSSAVTALAIGSVLISSSASSAQKSTADPAPASSGTAASTGSGGGGASCGAILADRKVGQFKADQFCPAIESLVETFRSADSKNYAPNLSYTSPTQAFFDGLAGSMKHYKGRSTVHVDIGGTTTVTLKGLDSLDDANGFKRNKLGLILERIRDGNGNGHHVGKVCTQQAEVAGELSFGTWLGSQILKYGLPALIKLIRGDPSKVVDKYDAMVTVERGSGTADTSAIRSIDFVPRGRLPAGCNQVPPHT